MTMVIIFNEIDFWTPQYVILIHHNAQHVHELADCLHGPI